MFQKNTFGASTSFGGFNAGATTSSPFSGFKPAGSTGAFGAAPAFGASAAAQPAAGGGLFGSPSTSTGLFGGGAATAAPAPAFGATGTGGFGFGQQPAGSGLFGAGATSGGLFGQAQPAASAFGAKPASFGFSGATTANTSGGGLFGASAGTSGLFGQQNNSMSGGGLFGGAAGGFGQQQQANGTALVKFQPVVGTDTMVKSGQTSTITIKHHCITCMKEYEGKSLEELRLEDYAAGRRGGAPAGGFGGAFQPAAEAKPAGGLFGQGAFGQPAAGGVFGGAGFPQANPAFSFGGATQTNTSTSLFGAAKPTFGATSTAGGGLFGTTAPQQTPAFGTTTATGFGFGAAPAQTQPTGLFGAKPAGGFGAAPAASGFGAFGTGGGGLFGAKTAAAPAFGAPTPAFGSTTAGAFGTATSSAGGIFGGGTALGAKPAAPTFGFGAPQPNQTLGGAGLGALGGAAFNQPKPTFPSFSGGAFSLAPQAAAPALGGFGTAGLGAGGFGTLGGGLGAPGALGFGAASLAPSVGSAAYAGNVHEQILSLASRPYGDSALFRDLPPSTGSAEDALRPTNPAAVQAVLDRSGYRVASPAGGDRLKVFPLGPAPSRNKKSLFDGLEEADASAEVRLSLKPSRKRLVLRPRQDQPHRPDDTALRTSLEERAAHDGPAGRPEGGGGGRSPGARVSFEGEVRGVNTDLEEDTERRSSWLGSRISPGSPRGRPASLERGGSPRLYPDLGAEEEAEGGRRRASTLGAGGLPRLYPDLDKENSDRRASWLTSKPLARAGGGGGAAAAESSVRELRPARRADASPHDKENIDTICDRSVHGFCGHRAGSAAHSRCEKISHQIRGIYVSEEESVSSPVEAPPHPAGVKLTRPGYYTVPSLQDMLGYMRPDGSCPVPQLTVGRRNYGSIHYDTEIDVAGLDLDRLVHFMNKEVMVYPDESEKPPVGEGLNRRAVVTLDRVWPRDKTARELIVDPERLAKMDYEARLRRVCDKHDTKFIEYRAQTGSWVFRVEHFSKYGLTDSDEEEEAPDVIRRQLRPTQPAAAPPLAAAAAIKMGAPSGLGGVSPPALGDAARARTAPAREAGADGVAPGALLPWSCAAPKGLAMDTSEENSMESQSLYPDTSSAFGVKSPTGELSRLDLHSSHRVQLMKASLYGDMLMRDDDDDVSVSTGDQLVPQPPSPSAHTVPSLGDADEQPPAEPVTQEVAMRPLLVTPHTVVLRHHGCVPPFAETIAGRLGAACVADVAVSRARHTRVGFAPGGRLALVTTRARLAALPLGAELSRLGEFVAGRGARDWSGAAVARLAVAGGDAAAGALQYQEEMEGHLLALLEHSDWSPAAADGCPRLSVRAEPASRLALLRAHVQHAALRRDRAPAHTLGVSAWYWREVWGACEALWAGELAGGGAAPADGLAARAALAGWLRAAVARATDEELAAPVQADPDDESDTHSQRVLTLMLGGRLTEACRVARDHGDLNMAVLISQAAGDTVLRQLIDRQLSVWRECGALRLVSRARLLALMLAAGRRTLDAGDAMLDACAGLDWLRAFNVHFSYVCKQVATVEDAVRSFEAMFRPAAADGDEPEDGDLTTLEERPGLEFPLPPYHQDYELTVEAGGARRRVLDLRYELLRARALGTRPGLQPAAYTADPLDYSLSFLVGTWLGQVSAAAAAGVADQLEAAGAWHLAALALMYHPHDAARAALVRGVISRQAPARDDSPAAEARLGFLRRLRLPERWTLLARAHRAKYEGLWRLEAEHLAGAGEWNAAHRVLLDKLMPDAVLADELEQLSALLERLHAAAEGERVAGWEAGGRALYLYLRVCNEIRGLVSEGGADADCRSALHARLEALRPRVALACRALGALASPTPRHAAARAEMGSRLLQLAVCAGATPHQLTAALKALGLPPDCRRPLLHKITSELAEQAAEACAESAGGSPISSRARSLVPAVVHASAD